MGNDEGRTNFSDPYRSARPEDSVDGGQAKKAQLDRIARERQDLSQAAIAELSLTKNPQARERDQKDAVARVKDEAKAVARLSDHQSTSNKRGLGR